MANGVAAITFDPLAFVKRLTSAGLSVEVAETLATEQSYLLEKVSIKLEQAISNVASKDELKEHKGVLKEYKSDFKEDFKRLEASFETKFSAVETRFDAKFDVLQAGISAVKSELNIIRWVLGAVAVTIVSSVVKLLLF